MTQTDLTLYEGQSWDTAAHVSRTDTRQCEHDVPRATVQLRRIGWIDQKGRVYKEVPPTAEFDGGSLTPLLINPGCD
jgi:hypothetical protein